jgi:hypothetical protein
MEEAGAERCLAAAAAWQANRKARPVASQEAEETGTGGARCYRTSPKGGVHTTGEVDPRVAGSDTPRSS